jgi:pimeloyl-ACP methyl ester carboxylesterase
MEERDLVLKGYDGRELWSTWVLPGDVLGPPVVMVHGLLGFKDWSFFPWLSWKFAEAGFPVLRFNCSGSGMASHRDGPFTDPEGFRDDTITRQVEDLHAVINCLVKGGLYEVLPPKEKVFLWGHSRGGGVAILTAEKDPAVAAVSTWATNSRLNRYPIQVTEPWRRDGSYPFESNRTGQVLRGGIAFLEDVEKWGREGDIPVLMHRLRVPAFLVHGAEDDSVKPEETESLASLNHRARLLILAGANHKFNADHPFTSPPPVLQEAARATVAFFTEVAERPASG